MQAADQGGGNVHHELALEGEGEREASLPVRTAVAEVPRHQRAGVVRTEDGDVPFISEDVIGAREPPRTPRAPVSSSTIGW